MLPAFAPIPGCVSCEILSGKRQEPGGVIYENAFWHVGSVLPPVVWPGFLIVKLKRHCEHIAELTTEEAGALGPVLRVASAALMEVLQPAKVYTGSFGEGTKHIHFWLLPRPQGMAAGLHPTLLRLDIRMLAARLPLFRRVVMTDAQVSELADRLRAQMLSQI